MSAKGIPDLDTTQGEQRRRLFLLFGLCLVLLVIFHKGFFLYLFLVISTLGLLSLAMASSGLSRIRAERQLSASEVEIGTEVTVRLLLRNGGALPVPWLFFSDPVDGGLAQQGPSCALMSIPATGKRELRYRMTPPRRGLYRVGPLLLESSGPFGLVRRYLLGKEAHFLTVLPTVVALRGGFSAERTVHQIPRRRSLFEDPTRFIGVREYQPGDSMRRIHWRATARSGRLQSRVYEPSVLEGVLLVLDMNLAAYPGLRGVQDSRRPEADPQVELAVTTCASLADHVLRGEQAAGLLANGADAAERYPTEWTGTVFQKLDSALLLAGQKDRVHRRRPVELPAAKGAWQRERMRTALARLIPAATLPLPELLLLEMPRLLRQLVLLIITPQLTPALGAALLHFVRSGFELSVVWVCDERPGAAGPPKVLPARVPLHVVATQDDLAALGGRRL